MALKTFHTANEAAQACILDASAPSSWECQTFTPFDSYTATSIKLKCYRNDASATGTVTIGIRAVDGDKKPTGANLDSGTIDVSGLGTSSPGAWATVTLTSGLALTAGTRYALVIYSSDISASDFVYFRTSSTTNYAFGTRGYSSNAGSSWSLYAGNTSDVVFKIYDDSTYTPQAMFVGGAVDGGKHLWKVYDDGETLSLVDSYALAGNVNCLAYSSDSNRLYAGIGSSVYCYDANDVSLVTSWGSSGSVAVGATVNGIDVDENDYLAVAHNPYDTNKRCTLYDDDGSVVWVSTSVEGTNGQKVSFSLTDGHVNISTSGGASGTAIAQRLSRVDGSTIVTYQDRIVSGYNGHGIDSSEDSASVCFHTAEYSSSSVRKYTNGSYNWQDAIAYGSTQDLIHWGDVDLVIIAYSNVLKACYDVDGDALPTADYGPCTNTHSTEGVINAITKNDDKEFYAATQGGYICVGNPGLSYKDSLQVSSAALEAVVHTGDYYSPISATGGGTGGGSANLTYGVWRKVLTEYMPNETPTFNDVLLDDRTASRLLATDSSKVTTSVTDLTNWIAGVANEIDIADDGDGTVTIGIVDPLIVGKGGTGAATLTDHSLLVGSGTSAITALGAATNGQLPIGSTGADPTLATLTGTSEQITITNGAGSITLAIDDPLTLPGKLKAGSFGSPTDVTATREYGAELHYSGNNYNVTGMRSRASLVTTDTTASCQGGLLQAANNDGINAGVLNGCLIEAIGKSDSTAATISTMRGCLINTEWNAKDTVTDLRILHVRTHTRNSATEGYFSNSGYGIYIENEAVGGNGQALTAGIYFKDTNISGGNSAFDYGIDFSGGTFATAEIKFSNGETISNLVDGTILFSSDLVSLNVIKLLEESTDPSEPSEGESVIWMSDGTGYGDDGDVCIASKAGGATTKAILFDKSAGDAW